MSMEVLRPRPQVAYRRPPLVMPFLGGAATPENLSQTLDTLYSTTWANRRATVWDNIFTATPFYYWLKKKGRIVEEVGSGRWFGVELMYGKNTTFKWIGPGGQIATTRDEIETTAKFDWKTAAIGVMRIYQEDKQNRGKWQIRKIMDDRLKNAELSMIDNLEVASFSDGTLASGLAFGGIQYLVKDDPTTNPANPPGNVGGIDAATNTWWRNQARTWDTTGLITGDTDIAFNLRKLYNACSQGNDHPTLIISDQAFYERYEATLSTKLQVREASLEEGDLGFQFLGYKGASMTWGASCPSQHAYMLNERYLYLVVEQSTQFELTEWKSIPDQLDRTAQIVLMGNVVVNNRRMNGVMIGANMPT